jgi:hypothetical protein
MIQGHIHIWRSVEGYILGIAGLIIMSLFQSIDMHKLLVGKHGHEDGNFGKGRGASGAASVYFMGSCSCRWGFHNMHCLCMLVQCTCSIIPFYCIDSGDFAVSYLQYTCMPLIISLKFESGCCCNNALICACGIIHPAGPDHR